MARASWWCVFAVVVNFATGEIPVELGTAGDFAIISKAGITNVVPSVIVGDIGVSPVTHTTLTGFALVDDSSGSFARSTQVTGFVFAANYALPTPSKMTVAIQDMETAYRDAAARTNLDPTRINLGAGAGIGGLTLTPGVYTWSTNIDFAADIFLSGSASDVFILQTAMDVVVGAETTVQLVGGAKARNVFWQVAGTVTVGTGSQMEGIILCKTGVTFLTNSKLNGRILAQTYAALQMVTVAQTQDYNSDNPTSSAPITLAPLTKNPTSKTPSVSTRAPTNTRTDNPTSSAPITQSPTLTTRAPNRQPTNFPTNLPTALPTAFPTAPGPTEQPTGSPIRTTKSPTSTTSTPTAVPSVSTGTPSEAPTTRRPTVITQTPSSQTPTFAPTLAPTLKPTPSVEVSNAPSYNGPREQQLMLLGMTMAPTVAPVLEVLSVKPLAVTYNTTVTISGTLLSIVDSVSVALVIENGTAVNETALDFSVDEFGRLEIVSPYLVMSETTLVWLILTAPGFYATAGLLYTPVGACPAGSYPNADRGAFPPCGPCPVGGHCPGGDVVWPNPGYSSASQTSLPVPCNYAKACPGVLFVTEKNVEKLSTTSCNLGYRGEICSKCAHKYTADGFRCRMCPPAPDSEIEFPTEVVVALAFFATIGLFLACLPTDRLVGFTAAFLDIQALSIIVSATTPYVDQPDWLVSVLGTLSMFLGAFNVELSIIKPGCGVPDVAFVWEIYGTVAFCVLLAGLYSFLACFHKPLKITYQRMKRWFQDKIKCCRPKQKKEKTVLTKKFQSAVRRVALTTIAQHPLVVRHRIVHALLIVATLFHLKVSTLLMKGIYCVDGVVLADQSLECYGEDHMTVAILCWVLLGVYGLGFPLFSAWLLRRNFGRASPDMAVRDKSEHDRLEKMGFFYMDLRPGCYYMHLLQFPANLSIAVAEATATDPFVNLFIMGVVALLLTHFTLVKKPFADKGDNTMELRTGVFTGLQTVFFIFMAILLTTPLLAVELPSWLGVPSTPPNDPYAAYAYAAITLVWTSWLVFFSIRGWWRLVEKGVIKRRRAKFAASMKRCWAIITPARATPAEHMAGKRANASPRSEKYEHAGGFDGGDSATELAPSPPEGMTSAEQNFPKVTTRSTPGAPAISRLPTRDLRTIDGIVEVQTVPPTHSSADFPHTEESVNSPFTTASIEPSLFESNRPSGADDVIDSVDGADSKGHHSTPERGALDLARQALFIFQSAGPKTTSEAAGPVQDGQHVTVNDRMRAWATNRSSQATAESEQKSKQNASRGSVNAILQRTASTETLHRTPSTKGPQKVDEGADGGLKKASNLLMRSQSKVRTLNASSSLPSIFGKQRETNRNQVDSEPWNPPSSHTTSDTHYLDEEGNDGGSGFDWEGDTLPEAAMRISTQNLKFPMKRPTGIKALANSNRFSKTLEPRPRMEPLRTTLPSSQQTIREAENVSSHDEGESYDSANGEPDSPLPGVSDTPEHSPGLHSSSPLSCNFTTGNNSRRASITRNPLPDVAMENFILPVSREQRGSRSRRPSTSMGLPQADENERDYYASSPKSRILESGEGGEGGSNGTGGSTENPSTVARGLGFGVHGPKGRLPVSDRLVEGANHFDPSPRTSHSDSPRQNSRRFSPRSSPGHSPPHLPPRHTAPPLVPRLALPPSTLPSPDSSRRPSLDRPPSLGKRALSFFVKKSSPPQSPPHVLRKTSQSLPMGESLQPDLSDVLETKDKVSPLEVSRFESSHNQKADEFLASAVGGLDDDKASLDIDRASGDGLNHYPELARGARWSAMRQGSLSTSKPEPGLDDEGGADKESLGRGSGDGLNPPELATDESLPPLARFRVIAKRVMRTSALRNSKAASADRQQLSYLTGKVIPRQHPQAIRPSTYGKSMVDAARIRNRTKTVPIKSAPRRSTTADTDDAPPPRSRLFAPSSSLAERRKSDADPPDRLFQDRVIEDPGRYNSRSVQRPPVVDRLSRSTTVGNPGKRSSAKS